jgi:hypothetical protein
MSSLRSRRQKRRSSRSPAVWHGSGGRTSSEQAALEHGVRNQFGLSSRILSGLVVAGLLLTLVVFFTADIFYVRGITVVGENYLQEAEVFRYSGIAEMHLFWVEPQEVRQTILEASPVVADVRVVVGWPPNMVKIYIEEREPALIWTQGGVSALVDLQGNVLRYPPADEEYPGMLRVIADSSIEGRPGLNESVPVDAVHGALQLQSLLSGVQYLRYHPIKGLRFAESESEWDVWLGVGTDMPNKLLIYETLRDNLLSRGIMPIEINVAHPEAVYYCASVEDCHE